MIFTKQRQRRRRSIPSSTLGSACTTMAAVAAAVLCVASRPTNASFVLFGPTVGVARTTTPTGIAAIDFANPTTSALLFRTSPLTRSRSTSRIFHPPTSLGGWLQGDDGEWVWEEDDGSAYVAPATVTVESAVPAAGATPTLPMGEFRPKQSLGQNFLRDGNTVNKIVRAFVDDASETLAESQRRGSGEEVLVGGGEGFRAVELGPGAGALTDVLVRTAGVDDLRCIEIDDRAVDLLTAKHSALRVTHGDVLQADYPSLAEEEGGPLSIIGNLPYYITSQILFALADASHSGSVRSATVTMQLEVAQRIVAPTRCKAYGILSVVFQLYADCRIHFKIPPTVFYPQPKVDSALVGLRFLEPAALRRRLGGVNPSHLRIVVGAAFRQRRKTVRNSLKKLAVAKFGGDKDRAREDFFDVDVMEAGVGLEEGSDGDASKFLPQDWTSKRPEELTPQQFVEVTRLLYGPRRSDVGTEGEGGEVELGRKVWRKLKHGSNE